MRARDIERLQKRASCYSRARQHLFFHSTATSLLMTTTAAATAGMSLAQPRTIVSDPTTRLVCEQVFAAGEVDVYGADPARNLLLCGVCHPVPWRRWIDATLLNALARHCLDQADVTRPFNIVPVLRGGGGAESRARPIVARIYGIDHGARRTASGSRLEWRRAGESTTAPPTPCTSTELVDWLNASAPIECDGGMPVPFEDALAAAPSTSDDHRRFAVASSAERWRTRRAPSRDKRLAAAAAQSGACWLVDLEELLDDAERM